MILYAFFVVLLSASYVNSASVVAPEATQRAQQTLTPSKSNAVEIIGAMKTSFVNSEHEKCSAEFLISLFLPRWMNASTLTTPPTFHLSVRWLFDADLLVSSFPRPIRKYNPTKMRAKCRQIAPPPAIKRNDWRKNLCHKICDGWNMLYVGRWWLLPTKSTMN